MVPTGAASEPTVAAHPKPSPSFIDVVIDTFYLAQISPTNPSTCEKDIAGDQHLRIVGCIVRDPNAEMHGRATRGGCPLTGLVPRRRHEHRRNVCLDRRHQVAQILTASDNSIDGSTNLPRR
jgi:hypothetical protein